MMDSKIAIPEGRATTKNAGKGISFMSKKEVCRGPIRHLVFATSPGIAQCSMMSPILGRRG